MRKNRREHGKADVLPSVLGCQPFTAQGLSESEKAPLNIVFLMDVFPVNQSNLHLGPYEHLANKVSFATSGTIF